MSFRPPEPSNNSSFPSKILPEEGAKSQLPTVSGMGRVSVQVSRPSKLVMIPSNDPGMPPKTVTSSLSLRSPLQGSKTPNKPPYPICSNLGWAEHVFGSSSRNFPDSVSPQFPVPYSQPTVKSPVTSPSQNQEGSSSSGLPHPVPIGFEGLYHNNSNLHQYKPQRSISPVNENYAPSSVPLSPIISRRVSDSPIPFGNLSVSAVSKKRDAQKPPSGKRYSADFNDVQADPDYPEVYGGMAMSRRAIGGSLNTGAVGFVPASVELDGRSDRVSSAPTSEASAIF